MSLGGRPAAQKYSLHCVHLPQFTHVQLRKLLLVWEIYIWIALNASGFYHGAPEILGHPIRCGDTLKQLALLILFFFFFKHLGAES